MVAALPAAPGIAVAGTAEEPAGLRRGHRAYCTPVVHAAAHRCGSLARLRVVAASALHSQPSRKTAAAVVPASAEDAGLASSACSRQEVPDQP